MTDNAAGAPAGPVVTPPEAEQAEVDRAESTLAVVGLLIGIGIALMGADLLSGGKVWAFITRRRALAAEPAGPDGA